jgi:hypothetical protein
MDYWIGPYGIKVPNNINCVIAEDGHNILYKDGEQTQTGLMTFKNKPITKEQYLKEYADLNNDGFYYWKEL